MKRNKISKGTQHVSRQSSRTLQEWTKHTTLTLNDLINQLEILLPHLPAVDKTGRA